jgi:hypothetical protein
MRIKGRISARQSLHRSTDARRGAIWACSLSVTSTEVPPLGLLSCRPARVQPYFYSDHQIRELMQAAKARPSTDPLRTHLLLSVRVACSHWPAVG